MSSPPTVALDRILDPVGRCLSGEAARALIALHTDPEVETRLEHLADGSTEGTLSAGERAEYETLVLVLAVDFVAILQAKARKLLAAAYHA